MKKQTRNGKHRPSLPWPSSRFLRAKERLHRTPPQPFLTPVISSSTSPPGNIPLTSTSVTTFTSVGMSLLHAVERWARSPGGNIGASPFNDLITNDATRVHAPGRGFEPSKRLPEMPSLPILNICPAAFISTLTLSISGADAPGFTTSSSIAALSLPMATSMTMPSRQTSSRLPSFQSLRRPVWLCWVA